MVLENLERWRLTPPRKKEWYGISLTRALGSMHIHMRQYIHYFDRIRPSLDIPLSPPPFRQSQTPSRAHALALACRPIPPRFSPAESPFSIVLSDSPPASSSIRATTPSLSMTLHSPSTRALPRSPNSPFPRRKRMRPMTCQAMHLCAATVDRLKIATSGIVYPAASGSWA